MTDPLEQFRALLPSRGSNRVENLRRGHNNGNNAIADMGGGGGGQHIDPPSGGGGGGVDPWQASVEKRLDSLDRRLTSVETGVGELKVGLATLVANVSHLPSKGFIITTLATSATLLAAASHFLPKILG